MKGENMKKTFSFFFALFFAFSSTFTTAFAASPQLSTKCSNVTFDGTDTHLGVFKSSMLPVGSSMRIFLKDWLDVMADYKAPADGMIYILTVIDSQPVFATFPANSKYEMYIVNNEGFGIAFSSKVSFIIASFGTKGWFNIPGPVSSSSGLGNLDGLILCSDPTYFTTPSNFDQSVTSGTGFAFNSDLYGTDWTGKLILDFDDDINAAPEPPAPPSSSEPPPPPPPPVDPPKLPEIPIGDGKYVVYDTSKWNGFLKYVQQAMGSSTTVGFMIFAIICGILLTIKIVKIFTKV